MRTVVENNFICTNERVIQRKLNNILFDECLVSIEESTSFGSPIYTVITWYDINEPYSFNAIEKDEEFKNNSEALKEMNKRARNWVQRFNDL